MCIRKETLHAHTEKGNFVPCSISRLIQHHFFVTTHFLRYPIKLSPTQETARNTYNNRQKTMADTGVYIHKLIRENT